MGSHENNILSFNITSGAEVVKPALRVCECTWTSFRSELLVMASKDIGRSLEAVRE